MSYTTKCVRCGKPAKMWSGILFVGRPPGASRRPIVSAGWCTKRCLNASEGLVGYHQRWMGNQTWRDVLRRDKGARRVLNDVVQPCANPDCEEYELVDVFALRAALATAKEEAEKWEKLAHLHLDMADKNATIASNAEAERDAAKKEAAAAKAEVERLRKQSQSDVDGYCYYRNLLIQRGAKPDEMHCEYDRKLARDFDPAKWDDPRDGYTMADQVRENVESWEARDAAEKALTTERARREAAEARPSVENCRKERAEGNGGCGACALCCCERRERVEKLEGAARTALEILEEKNDNDGNDWADDAYAAAADALDAALNPKEITPLHHRHPRDQMTSLAARNWGSWFVVATTHCGGHLTTHNI